MAFEGIEFTTNYETTMNSNVHMMFWNDTLFYHVSRVCIGVVHLMCLLKMVLDPWPSKIANVVRTCEAHLSKKWAIHRM
jgi:hypothetical protein